MLRGCFCQLLMFLNKIREFSLNQNIILPIFVLVFFGLLLILGGLGVKVEIVSYFGVFAGILLLLLIFISGKQIKLPPGAILYQVFLIIFLINTFIWSFDTKKSLEVFSLFLAGAMFWIITYNLKDFFRRYFIKLIIVLGLTFGGLFFINQFFGNPTAVAPWSLYLQYAGYLNHNHIGDLWALVLAIAFYQILRKRGIYWLLVLPGAYFLLVSLSRSAYLALTVGVLYIFLSDRLKRKNKLIFFVFLILVAIIFIIVGTSKTTLLARPYFIQAVLGLIHNPLGVGMGNFGYISADPENIILGLSHYSSVVHSVVLEVMSGLGVLGLIFVVWLAKTLYDFWYDVSGENLIFKAIFVVLLANFLFDSTYFVPTMLWLWLASLGLTRVAAQTTDVDKTT